MLFTHTSGLESPLCRSSCVYCSSDTERVSTHKLQNRKQFRGAVGATFPPDQSLENMTLWRMENMTPPLWKMEMLNPSPGRNREHTQPANLPSQTTKEWLPCTGIAQYITCVKACNVSSMELRPFDELFVQCLSLFVELLLWKGQN